MRKPEKEALRIRGSLIMSEKERLEARFVVYRMSFFLAFVHLIFHGLLLELQTGVPYLKDGPDAPEWSNAIEWPYAAK